MQNDRKVVGVKILDKKISKKTYWFNAPDEIIRELDWRTGNLYVLVDTRKGYKIAQFYALANVKTLGFEPTKSVACLLDKKAVKKFLTEKKIDALKKDVDKKLASIFECLSVDYYDGISTDDKIECLKFLGRESKQINLISDIKELVDSWKQLKGFGLKVEDGI